MSYLSVKQAAQDWKISEERVEELCKQGILTGVVMEGRAYFIPENTQCPVTLPSLEARPSSPEYEELITRIDNMKKQVDERRDAMEDEWEALEESFMVRFTYESDAIEGNTLSLEETGLVLSGHVISGKSLKEHLQAVGHRDAFRHLSFLVRNRPPLSENIIRDLHALILVDSPDQRGRYRAESLHIMGAFHQPPEADRVPAKMAKQVAKYRQPECHPVENAVLFLLKFVGIHPFMDANGRTGRMLLNFMLMQQGYPPVSIRIEDRSTYYEAIDSYYRDHSAAPMVALIAGYVEERLQEYLVASI